MDSYMLIIYVTLKQEEAIRKLFYEQGWKYIKEDGDITIVRGDELPDPISSDVEHVGSTDLNSFHYESSCPEENKVSRPDFASCGDQIRTCSFNSQDNSIVYNSFGIHFENSNTENSSQHKKSLTEILDKEQVNRNKSCDSVHNLLNQDSYIDNDQSKNNVNSNMKIFQEKDLKKGFIDDNFTKCELKCEKELTSNGQDNEIDKFDSKSGLSLQSNSIEKEQNSVDHLISRGKLLSIENRTRLKKDRKTLKKKSSNISRCKITTKKKPIFCTDCKVTFTSQKRYDKHKERNGGQCVFPCEFCDKVFLYRKSRYDLHVRSAHSKERPFKCDVCQKGYITSDKLKIHKRVHTGERPCVCEECGKAFYSRGDLSTHREYHHISKERQDNLVCDLCNLTFCNQRYLTYHKNVTHSSRRDFHCQTCSKSFKSNSSLKRHLKYIHSDIKSFRCDTCDKCFKTSGSLAKHKVRHGGERTFFCSDCNKGFYEKTKLEQHIRTHTGEKPYKCHLCEYKCALSGNLSKHMKTHYRELTNAVL